MIFVKVFPIIFVIIIEFYSIVNYLRGWTHFINETLKTHINEYSTKLIPCLSSAFGILKMLFGIYVFISSRIRVNQLLEANNLPK